MSKFKIAFYACLLMMIFGAAPASADEEASNVAYVKTSKYGRSYAKCIPSEPYGSKGVTKVYLVREGEDQLESSYPWYSKEVYLSDRPGGVSVVRLGPWARGQTAKREDLAIGFYFSGGTLKEYSTLDIAGMPDNVGRSVSHYTVFKEVAGYRETEGGAAFDVVAVDGRVISFDVRTSEILEKGRN
jgi:hypothetical protein